MTKKINGLPIIALYLGYGGVVPFLALTVFILLGYSSMDIIVILVEVGVTKDSGFNSQPKLFMSLHAWMAIYAAIILSFIGAIHWGVVIALNDKLNSPEKNKLLIYSNVPALLAWCSFLLPINITLFLLALMILLTYFLDRLLLFKKLALNVSQDLAQDFARLRLHLSVVVSILLFVTALNYSG
ncbi:MAG: DUF3429 domain-containing protein [Cocleimonas sp.]